MTISFLKDLAKHFPTQHLLCQTNNLENLNINDEFDYLKLNFTTYHIEKIEYCEKYIYLILEPSTIEEQKSINAKSLLSSIEMVNDDLEVLFIIKGKNGFTSAYNVAIPTTVEIVLYHTIIFNLLPYCKKSEKTFNELFSERLIERGKERLKADYVENNYRVNEHIEPVWVKERLRCAIF